MPGGFTIVPARTFRKGDVIFRQDDPMNGEAFLVHKGAVEVRRRVDGEERLLKVLGPGDLLGEVALFRAAPHSATAVAAGPVTLLVIEAERLEDLIRAHPKLAMAIIRQLARMAAGEDGSGG
jgi:CRP-like cAMP-binding protein